MEISLSNISALLCCKWYYEMAISITWFVSI